MIKVVYNNDNDIDMEDESGRPQFQLLIENFLSKSHSIEDISRFISEYENTNGKNFDRITQNIWDQNPHYRTYLSLWAASINKRWVLRRKGQLANIDGFIGILKENTYFLEKSQRRDGYTTPPATSASTPPTTEQRSYDNDDTVEAMNNQNISRSLLSELSNADTVSEEQELEQEDSSDVNMGSGSDSDISLGGNKYAKRNKTRKITKRKHKTRKKNKKKNNKKNKKKKEQN